MSRIGYKLIDEGQGFAKFLKSLEQFIRTVEGQNNFEGKLYFNYNTGVFLFI